MLTIAVANIRGIVSESLHDPEAAHHRAYRVTCTMCGEVQEFRSVPGEWGSGVFQRYTLYKIEHRKSHTLPVDAFGTEALF